MAFIDQNTQPNKTEVPVPGANPVQQSIPPQLPVQPQPIVPPPPIASVVPPGKNSSSSKKKLLVMGLIVVVLVVLGVVAFFGYSQYKDKQIQQEAIALGQSAQTDYNKGNYQSAEQKLSQALFLTKNNSSLFAAMINVIASEGNQTGQEAEAYQKAQQYINTAISLYPKNEDILVAVGYINEIDGKYTQADNYYKQAISVNSKDANAWFHYGHNLEFLGQQQQAFQAYDKAYSLDPKNSSALMGKARESIFTNKLADAAGFYDKVATSQDASDAMRAEAYLDEAIIKQSQLLYTSQTLTLIQKSLMEDPTYSPALAFYGYSIALDEGKLKEGTTYIDKAIKANPRISQNYYYMGLILNSGKYYPSAISYYKYGYNLVNSDNTLVSQSQKNNMKANIAYSLARSLTLNGGSSDTLNYLETAIQINPNLKKVLNYDYNTSHYFSELSKNQEFLSLLKS